jgi:CRISPR system Cascade subunit CasE
MTLYFSRIRLSLSPSAQALAGLLAPSEPGPRSSAQHKLLWAAFSDGPDRRRDFLWREDHDGTFLTLSVRPPQPMDLFVPHEVKPFDPVLAPGQKLDFVLRANATRMKRDTRRRVDVVMDALHDLPKGARVPERLAAAKARRGWGVKVWRQAFGSSRLWPVITPLWRFLTTVVHARGSLNSAFSTWRAGSR